MLNVLLFGDVCLRQATTKVVWTRVLRSRGWLRRVREWGQCGRAGDASDAGDAGDAGEAGEAGEAGDVTMNILIENGRMGCKPSDVDTPLISLKKGGGLTGRYVMGMMLRR